MFLHKQNNFIKTDNNLVVKYKHGELLLVKLKEFYYILQYKGKYSIDNIRVAEDVEPHSLYYNMDENEEDLEKMIKHTFCGKEDEMEIYLEKIKITRGRKIIKMYESR